jgi:ABC-type antimicrobial peptide transport system permease subunit
MIWARIIFGGLGRRGLQAIVAGVVLAVAAATVAESLMIVEGAGSALARAEREDRPDIIRVKSRFNRALFETPRSGALPPVTLPVYEPLVDHQTLASAADGATVLARQSFLRNVVSADGFLNVYIFGIEPEKESQISTFSVGKGRFLRSGDGAVAVLDEASTRALRVDLGGVFLVRKADGQDLRLTVVGILDRLNFRDAPPRTLEAPALAPNSSLVSSGVFVPLQVSEDIFGRSTLTDALVLAGTPGRVPTITQKIREAFRLEPGVFVTERYREFRRKVSDFVLTRALFVAIATIIAVLAGTFAANLLHDVYADRRRHFATLLALGFSPAESAVPGLALGLSVGVLAAGIGVLAAISLAPKQFGMPSLMADLGSIEPRFDLFVTAVVTGMVVAAVALGMVSTAWKLYRQPLATNIADDGR